MSYRTKDDWNEQYSMLEDDYKDDLKALENARKEMSDAYEWQKKMELKCNESAKALSDFKNQD